jgi:hypothetical protein
MRAPNDWTFEGICPSGVPRPGKGAVSMTSTGGNGTGSSAQSPGDAMAAATAPVTMSAARGKRTGFADRNLGDLLVRQVDDRDCIGAPARDADFFPSGVSAVPQAPADQDLDDGVDAGSITLPFLCRPT